MLFSADFGMADFSKMLVFREFGRRPAKAVNLETMGLMTVCYPALSQVTRLPLELSRENITLQDWKDFLLICLDFVFRGSGAIDFPREWRKWLGMAYRQNFMLPPDRNKNNSINSIT